jgi:hypothetical protein
VDIYKLKNGRFILAQWSERNAQFTACVTPAPFQGYCYSYARTPDGLPGARRALKRDYA